MNILKKAYNYRVWLIGAAFWSISAASAYCGVFPVEGHLRKPMIFSEDGERERAESALLYGSGIQRDPGLIRLLRSKIEREGKITFEEFMKTALYSENGYYYGGNAYITNGLGLKGDFFTLPERGFKTFGPALAEQFVEIWKTMGEPSVFPVVEMGAGNGTLAKTVLTHLRKRHKEGLFRSIDYVIVEISPALISRQKKNLRKSLFSKETFPVRWVNGSALDLPLRNIEGVFISNELPDTFPAHIVQKDGEGVLKEVYVTYENGEFKKTLGELSDFEAINKYLEMARESRGGAEVENVLKGKGLPVNLNMIKWQEALSNSLIRGYVITLDYGYNRDRLENNAFPMRGYIGDRDYAILLAQNPERYIIQYPGAIDITSDVDFRVLSEIGEKSGFDTIGVLPQGRFFSNICGAVKGIDSHLKLLYREHDYVLIQSKNIGIKKLMGFKNSGSFVVPRFVHEGYSRSCL